MVSNTIVNVISRMPVNYYNNYSDFKGLIYMDREVSMKIIQSWIVTRHFGTSQASKIVFNEKVIMTNP